MTNNKQLDELIQQGIIEIDLSHVPSKYFKSYPYIIQSFAEMSYCERQKVGAILVSSDYSNVISYGYNGTLPNFPNVCELSNGETNEEIVLHAETNCITKASKNGINTNNTSLWTSLSPCSSCAKFIIQSGIKEVFFIYPYRNLDSLKILHQAGVKIYYLLLD